MITKVYGSATTTTASVATIDVAVDQRIVGALVSVAAYAAAAAQGVWTLSFGSTDLSVSNDTRTEILTAAVGVGATGPSINFFVPLDELVYAGERIHLHFLLATGTMTANAIRIMLLSDAKASGRTIRR